MANKISVNVDGTGYRDLTALEAAVLQSALENYARNRGAQKMLDVQKKENKTKKEEIAKGYDKILATITQLREALT
jgi:hypothetical protein